MKLKIVLWVLLLMFVCNIHSQDKTVIQGDSLFALGNYSKAIEIYKKDNSFEYYEKIAEAYMGIGNYDKSIEYYNMAIIQKPKNTLVKYKYAKLLARLKKNKEALDMFQELLKLDNKNPNHYYELGLILEKQKDQQALDKFRKVYQLDNTHQKAIYKLAKYHLLKKQYDSVNYYTDKGLNLYGNNKSLISLKAQNFYKKEAYLEAIKWFEKLIDLNEESQFVYEKLSSCYKNINKVEKAIEHSLLALTFNGFDIYNLNTLSELYMQIEDYKKAENYLNKVILVLDVPVDNKYVRLGYAQHQQNKYKEAIESLKIALNKNRDNEDAHFYLAYTKDKYYKDLHPKINLYENFIKKYPETKFKNTVDSRLKLLKKERFLKRKNNDR